MKPTWLWWSSGKDSAWALHVLRQQREFEVRALVTTVNRTFERVAMHGVREQLLQRQAQAAGLPLQVVDIPHPCSNADYEHAVAGLLQRAAADGVQAMAFGDLFLEDVRHYRERMLAGSDIAAVFPLWGADTGALSQAMVAGELRAYTTCIDPQRLARRFVGREYDPAFLADLPASVDPCGENGEFHTYAFDGPMFSGAIDVRPGEIVEREGFVFADLQPTGAA